MLFRDTRSDLTNKMTSVDRAKPEDYINQTDGKADRPEGGTEKIEYDELEIKQESLAILAALGTTKEYLGIEMSLGDVKKLSAKDVEKYFNRYQSVMGKKINGGLVDSSLELVSKLISYLVPVDDIDALCDDLKKDNLVNRELTNFVGLLALKSGRLAALASGVYSRLLNTLNSTKINKNQEKNQ